MKTWYEIETVNNLPFQTRKALRKTLKAHGLVGPKPQTFQTLEQANHARLTFHKLTNTNPVHTEAVQTTHLL